MRRKQCEWAGSLCAAVSAEKRASAFTTRARNQHFTPYSDRMCSSAPDDEADHCGGSSIDEQHNSITSPPTPHSNAKEGYNEYEDDDDATY